jgi:hypothetical protein
MIAVLLTNAAKPMILATRPIDRERPRLRNVRQCSGAPISALASGRVPLAPAGKRAVVADALGRAGFRDWAEGPERPNGAVSTFPRGAILAAWLPGILAPLPPAEGSGIR